MAIMTQKERDTLKDVEKNYTDAKQKLSSKFTKFKELEEAYYSHLKNETNPWKSTIYDPEAFEKVERMTAHTVASSPRGSFLPQEDSDNFSVAVADQYFKYQWDDPKAEMFRKITDMAKMAGIFGTSFGYLCWMWDRREQEIISEKGKTKFIQLWDGPFFKPLDPRDVFPDPAAIDQHSMEWVIINQFYTLDELKGQNATYANKEKRFKNLGILEDKLKNKKNITASQEDFRRGYNAVSGREEPNGVKNRILVRTKFARDRWVSWCPDYNILIEDHANPYEHFELPIHVLIDQNIPGQLYGMGEIEPILPLQRGLNSVVNQRLDNVRLIMNSMFKVKEGAEYSYTFKSEPGAKWVVRNMDDVEPFNIPDVTGNMFLSTVNYFKDSISKATGNTDILTNGVMQNGARTATELNLANQEQNARLKSKENFLDEFIRRLCTQWMQLNQQFLDNKQVIRVIGADAVKALEQNPQMYDQPQGQGMQPQVRMTTYKGKDKPKLSVDASKAFAFMVVEPEDIQGHFDFVVESGSTSKQDENQAVQNAIAAVNLLSNPANAEALQKENKQVSLAPVLSKVVAKLVPSIKNPEEIIGNIPPEVLQQQQQLMQQQMQAQNQPPAPPQPKLPSETLNYRDAPPDIQRQIEEQAGLQPSKMPPINFLNQIHGQPQRPGTPSTGAGNQLQQRP